MALAPRSRAVRATSISSELANCTSVLLAHLLKWQYQPGWRSKSWQFTIRTQRKEVACVLSEAPGLRGKFGDEAWLDIVWSKARSIASNETGLDLDAFPEVLPWQVDGVLLSEFYAG
ncbi:hypothetical protein AWB69_08424 [Caballeronia udeis]|uniref:Uncharacterized protein n=1 Tax=Caballeronia udeis TaxID=1232866 RepID=A0A158JPE2_9BURK|nr:DUF29 domain-containing protein [Caballeronia udeis]SAL70742.1 hypothetical protein AWB69_08424 [Caballeronia udeis]